MIQQDHLQIFDLTLNVWAPLFVGNGSSYTKKRVHVQQPQWQSLLSG